MGAITVTAMMPPWGRRCAFVGRALDLVVVALMVLYRFLHLILDGADLVSQLHSDGGAEPLRVHHNRRAPTAALCWSTRSQAAAWGVAGPS